MEANVAAVETGLRARHKERTRQAISDAATELFIENGFEQVTVAEIAAAADVSVKTVFNYFPSKEDLFFDRADELIDALADAIRARPAGTTVIVALHRLLGDRRFPFDEDGWRALRDRDRFEGYRAFIATEQASPALRARRVAILHGWAARLTELLTAELGVSDVVARTLTGFVLGAMGVRERTLSTAVLEGASPQAIERRVRAVVDEAFGRIALAFADVDR